MTKAIALTEAQMSLTKILRSILRSLADSSTKELSRDSEIKPGMDPSTVDPTLVDTTTLSPDVWTDPALAEHLHLNGDQTCREDRDSRFI